jgi:hypothetical protein
MRRCSTAFCGTLTTKGVTLATFGAAHVESFFADIEKRCTPGTTTRLRYGRMLDRLCRHLVEEGIREENPVTAMAAFERWPEDEPVPLFLDVDADISQSRVMTAAPCAIARSWRFFSVPA